MDLTIPLMTNKLFAALAAGALLLPSASLARPVDPGFSAPEVDPGFSVNEPQVGVGSGINPIAAVLLFPIYAAARAQAALQPEKNSCWNGDSSKVAGCNYAERADQFVDNRPTPYGY